MNIYIARYKNALKKAAKVNRLLKKGYHVFHRGEPTKQGFILKDNQLLLKHNDFACTIYYENDKEWDHGYWTPIKQWNESFAKDFEAYDPRAKVTL